MTATCVMNKSPNLLQFVPPRLKLEVALSFKSLADLALLQKAQLSTQHLISLLHTFKVQGNGRVVFFEGPEKFSHMESHGKI